MNLALIYGILAAIALILAACSCTFIKKKEIWLILLSISVFIVNIGYFSLAVSKSLEEALLANRISYLGSVFLPLCMLMTVFDVCGIKTGKIMTTVLVCISVAVFLLAASGGYTDWYYKEVSLIYVSGAARLDKVYGDFHIVYLIYLLLHFASMVGAIIISLLKKISSYKYAAMLASVVLLNIIIWFVEQMIANDFEFLSVSYIASEIILLFLYSLMQDEKKNAITQTDTVKNENCISSDGEEKHHTDVDFIAELWREEFSLTAREEDVLRLLLEGKKRKDIAEELFLSKNTVKTHSSRVFAKLGVANKNELKEKAYNITKSV